MESLLKEYKDYVEQHLEELQELLLTLCQIPSPTGHEDARADFIASWFRELGGSQAVIDSAKNVILPFGCDEHEDIVVFMAHTDTVFPDREPLPLRIEDGILYCPGCGDDTANLAIMMMCVKYLLTHPHKPSCGVLFVADSCEEGLGNLNGCRQLMTDYGHRIRQVISLDGTYNNICFRAVGSSRYKIEVETEGGHSFSDFGKQNAIYHLSNIVTKLYGAKLPEIGDSITTYNVGSISGGTSINTIAQHAEMLFEYRSDNAVCLEMMNQFLKTLLEEYQKEHKAGITLTHLGTRPCMSGVNQDKQDELVEKCYRLLTRHLPQPPSLTAGSTDCNLPLSMGIPAISFGLYHGGGMHTREEWLELSSLKTGFAISMEIIGTFFSASQP